MADQIPISCQCEVLLCCDALQCPGQLVLPSRCIYRAAEQSGVIGDSCVDTLTFIPNAFYAAVETHGMQSRLGLTGGSHFADGLSPRAAVRSSGDTDCTALQRARSVHSFQRKYRVCAVITFSTQQWYPNNVVACTG